MKLFTLAVSGLVLLLSTAAFATDAEIKNKLIPFGITNVSITDSPIEGLKTVVSDQGVYYTSENGKYFLQGSLVEVTKNGAKDLSNQPLMAELNSLEKDMIIYPAENEKHVITVFTDITCGYCLMLHKHIPAYNNLGITVRYLAFPRAGTSSSVARQMETIWQSEDRNAAFLAAENGHPPKKETKVDIVKKEYNLGKKFAITGTPAIILEDGSLLPGYVEPARLFALLEQN